MTRRRPRTFLELGLDSAAIGWAAPQVIAMRLLKLSRGGPAASREAERMVSEKMRAAFEIGHAVNRAALTGDASDLAGDTLDALHGPVKANRRRLARELRRGD